MREIKKYIKFCFLFIRENIYFLSFGLSTLSLFFISLNVFGILPPLQNYSIIGNLVQIILLFSTIFTLVLLPSYPVFFFILKKKNYNFLEKLSLTIIVNLSFYIIGGFFGYLMGFPITGAFLFNYVLISYGVILIYIFFIEYKQQRFEFFKLSINLSNLLEKSKTFSIRHAFKQIFSINGLLLGFFMLLLIMLFTISVPFFGGTDPWLHISIIKVIIENNTLPFNEYYGAMGLHIFSANIYFFSGMDVIFIPRFFTLYTFPVASLIVYNLFRRIFKNRNLAIFGVYILLFSSLGYGVLLYQFWPTAIAFIQGLFIFYVLYTRFKLFYREDTPSLTQIKFNLPFSYLLIIIVFIGALISHSLITIIMLISYLIAYSIYFIKNYKRGFDFTILVVLVIIFLIFYVFNIGTGHFKVFNYFFELPTYIIISGIAGIFILVTLLILWQRRRIIFIKGRYQLILKGKKYAYYKKIEEKYIIPLVFVIAIVFSIIGLIANTFWFNFNIITLFSSFEVFLFIIFAVWGLGLYQNKPKGKILWLWGFSLSLILAAGFAFDALTNSFTFFSRIFYLCSVVLAIGFISYIYKQIKTGLITNIKMKILLFFLITFSLIATYSEEMNSIDIFSLKRREVSSIQWYANYNPKNSTIICEFGWNYLFVYYSYPFANYSESQPFKHFREFIFANDSFMHPSNHINSSGVNLLKELKIKSNHTDVILILSDYYLLLEGITFFGELTSEEIEKYYSLTYLNRIFTSKNEWGEETPYYWVI